MAAFAWGAAPALAQQAASPPQDAAETVLLALGPTPNPGGPAGPQPGLALDVRPSLSAARLPTDSTDVGVKWRQPFGAQHRVDIAAWRRSTPPSDALGLIQQREPVFGARVEFKLASRTPFATDARFIGFQLDSGARIGIRRSNGNPTLYYRAQF